VCPNVRVHLCVCDDRRISYPNPRSHCETTVISLIPLYEHCSINVTPVLHHCNANVYKR
jgi:hypothetical protein